MTARASARSPRSRSPLRLAPAVPRLASTASLRAGAERIALSPRLPLAVAAVVAVGVALTR